MTRPSRCLPRWMAYRGMASNDSYNRRNGETMNGDALIAEQVKLAMLRNRHNTLADIEEFCTGTAAKLKRYAPLLRRVAAWKAAIRSNMDRIEATIGGSAE